jgi:hypothetical protein
MRPNDPNFIEPSLVFESNLENFVHDEFYFKNEFLVYGG